MASPRPSRRRFQFTLATLLFMAVPISLLAAAFSGMLHPATPPVRLPRAFFVVLATAIPLGLTLAVGLFSVLVAWMAGRRSR